MHGDWKGKKKNFFRKVLSKALGIVNLKAGKKYISNLNLPRNNFVRYVCVEGTYCYYGHRILPIGILEIGNSKVFFFSNFYFSSSSSFLKYILTTWEPRSNEAMVLGELVRYIENLDSTNEQKNNQNGPYILSVVTDFYHKSPLIITKLISVGVSIVTVSL